MKIAPPAKKSKAKSNRKNQVAAGTRKTTGPISRKAGAPAASSADPDEPTNAERIWQVVAAIPAGKVATYGQVADLAGLPRGARLVGRTMSNLPRGSKLPWFRVINSRGELSFPRNSASWRRQRDALREDGVVLIKGRLSLKLYRWEP